MGRNCFLRLLLLLMGTVAGTRPATRFQKMMKRIKLNGSVHANKTQTNAKPKNDSTNTEIRHATTHSDTNQKPTPHNDDMHTMTLTGFGDEPETNDQAGIKVKIKAPKNSGHTTNMNNSKHMSGNGGVVGPGIYRHEQLLLLVFQPLFAAGPQQQLSDENIAHVLVIMNNMLVKYDPINAYPPLVRQFVNWLFGLRQESLQVIRDEVINDKQNTDPLISVADKLTAITTHDSSFDLSVTKILGYWFSYPLLTTTDYNSGLVSKLDHLHIWDPQATNWQQSVRNLVALEFDPDHPDQLQDILHEILFASLHWQI